jgi:hypothetical protein
MKIWLLAFAFIMNEFSLAQGNELAGTILYDMPQADLGTVFSPAPLFQLSYESLSNYKKKLNSIGVTLGYSSMSPQKPVFEYPVEVNGVPSIEKATYSSYSSFQLFLNVKKGYVISKMTELFYGGDIGYHYTSYQYTLSSAVNSSDGSNTVSRGALGPKLGLSFILGKSWRLNTQIRYLFSIGKNDNESNLWNTYISIGGGVGYRF